MKKVVFGLTAVVFMVCLFLESCTTNDSYVDVKTEAFEDIILKKYNLVKSTNSSLNLFEDLKENKNDIIEEYRIKSSNESVIIIKNILNNDFRVIKGYISNSSKPTFNIIKNLKVTISNDKNVLSSMIVENETNNEKFSCLLNEGIPYEIKNLQPENILLNRNLSVRADPKLCQRENGETTSQCYKREVDEFCDGFIGCIALTQVSVHLLILALCSC